MSTGQPNDEFGQPIPPAAGSSPAVPPQFPPASSTPPPGYAAPGQAPPAYPAPGQPVGGYAASGQPIAGGTPPGVSKGFDPKTVTTPQWLVLGGTAVFLISLLLPWVSVSVSDELGDLGLGSVGGSVSGLSQSMLVLALLLLLAASAWLLLPSFGVNLDVPVPRAMVTLGLTGLALLLTLIKFLDVLTSGSDVEGFGVEVSTGIGAYLGFLAAVAAVAGAAMMFLASRSSTNPAA